MSTAVILPDHEASLVRAHSERLGLPGLIDIHTHFMPPRVMAKVWAYFDQIGERIGRPWPIAYRMSEPERIRRLRDFGVLAFTSMVYPHKPDMAEWLNEWAADFARSTPDCIQTATFFPEPSAARYVDEALAQGARIVKVHVQVGDYDPTDPLLDPVWGMLQDARVPIVIHAGSGPRPGAHTGPANVAAVLRRFPELRLVIAHLGMPEYAEFFDLADAYPGVHLDTTMAFTDFAAQVAPFPTALRGRLSGLGDRILFGSDFPNIPYPYLHALDAITRLELGAAWERGVLHDNAARLLGEESACVESAHAEPARAGATPTAPSAAPAQTTTPDDRPAPPITTLLLDADGVVQHNPHFRPGMSALLGERATVLELLDVELGSISGERDLRADLEAFLAERGIEATFEDLLAVWTRMEPAAEVLAMVDQVRARGVTVHLATNQQSYRGAFMIERLGYERHFDSTFYSFQLGLAKPDPAFFRHVVEDLDVDPAGTLFIDDVVANVDGAREAGLVAEHVDRDDGPAGIAEVLRRHGLLVEPR